MECTHAEEMREAWSGWVPGVNSPFCGEFNPHAPHEGCGGIMCDYGCNAEDF